MCSCCTGLGLIVFTVIKSFISIHPTNLFSIGFHPAHESEDLLGLCSVKKQSFSYFLCILAAKLDVAQVRVVEALHVQYGLSCPMSLYLSVLLTCTTAAGGKHQSQLLVGTSPA